MTFRIRGWPAVSAGTSAAEEARSATVAAGVLERKAAYARQRAENVGKGAEGERLVAQALAPLTTRDGFVLHDRAAAHGGNIDNLVIGTRGVPVLDAKHWVSEVSVRDELQVGGRSAMRAVDHLADLTAQVRASMAPARIDLPVTGMPVFTHDTNAFMPRHPLRNMDLVGRHYLLPALTPEGSATRVHVRPLYVTSAKRSRRMARRSRTPRIRLSRRPPSTRGPTPTSSSSRGPGRGGGGSTSVTTRAATWDTRTWGPGWSPSPSPTRTRSSGDSSPKRPGRGWVPRLGICLNSGFELGGNRLISRLSSTWITLHVGSHWLRRPLNGLYGTRVSHEDGVHNLGYVDLATRLVCPVSDLPLAKELSPPSRYPERLGEAYAASKRARAT